MRTLLALLLGIVPFILAEKRSPSVPLVIVQDSINPGTADYILEQIQEADQQNAPYLILQLDTPGGLLTATRQIIQGMLSAKTPIVVFIAPKGAQAGSAGALITFAADVAAMAPGSNIGAAHPVSVGGEKVDDTMKEKLASDVAAFAESLAKTKGRNTKWAVQAVRKSAAIPADEALAKGVVDLIADDVLDLTKKLAGYRLKVAKGDRMELPKQVPSHQTTRMTIKQRVVSFFADPNLAYLIMTLGGLCLWVELTHPGLIFPGVLGLICIIISLVSFQTLPIDYGALALIFVGMAMLIAELFLPTFGLLGLAGVGLFIFGSLFLMDTDVPELRISLALILPTAAVIAGFAFTLGWLLLRSRTTRRQSGLEAMVGEFGEVRETIGKEPGKVFVRGELWNAVSQSGEELLPGSLVTVLSIQGMCLVVAKQG